MEEELETLERRGSISALSIFVLVLVFEYATRRLQQWKERASMSSAEIELRKEIKNLLNEASSFSQPSTFAQAAKLRRLAAAKEKELAKCCDVGIHFEITDINHAFVTLVCIESKSKEIKLSFGFYLKALQFSKVAIYFLLVCWYWRSGHPVASISQQLLQPFGRLLSFAGGGSSNGQVMVGIVPWMAITSRVSKYICGSLPSTRKRRALWRMAPQ